MEQYDFYKFQQEWFFPKDNDIYEVLTSDFDEIVEIRKEKEKR